jgi:SAM-dependent methyltransferase
MIRNLITFLRQRVIAGRIPQGSWGLKLMGHRMYVGGRWDEIGQLQFDFLVKQGLQPTHRFMDVGCGSLRGGVHFIKYLEPGNYLGLDKEAELIRLGTDKELPQGTVESKTPEFVVSDSFEFERFSDGPDFALAQSLFTHLARPDIEVCLRKLRPVAHPGCRFFATFFEGTSVDNADASHSLDHFEYSREEMEAMGVATGWRPRYVGNWEHPRGQMLMEYMAADPADDSGSEPQE